jgi:shikimate kinase
MNERHLVLIGMMGSGKSTVGAACAAALGCVMIDTDELVETQSAMTVAEIFEHFGEADFRRREIQAVADAAASPQRSVISCGGGVMLDSRNREALRAAGYVVWLDADIEVLVRRVGDGARRPLLRNADPFDVLSRLRAIRGPSYEAAADIRIDTSLLKRNATVEAVLDAYESGISNER